VRLVAFFDFDGTITNKDSLLEFIRYCKGRNAFYAGFILNAPYLVAYKLRIISNQRAKEKMLHHFFGNMPVEVFNHHCESFFQEIIPSLIRPKALKEIKKLQEAGAEVVIVSASPENWLRSWCISMHVKLIGTRLEICNNRITGKIDGNNCHGKEKVSRIKKSFDLSVFTSVYCYGDTPGDKPMLSLGNHAFYKPFR